MVQLVIDCFFVSLHHCKAFCKLHHITLHRDLFLCSCCSFLTCDNSLLFYFIRYIIGNFFVVVLSVYVGVFLCLLARLSASCHIVTCFFVDVVDFSLVTTLFVLFHLVHYWQLCCGCIECLCVCFLASLCVLVRLSASCHIATCFFAVVAVLSHSWYSSNLWHVI